MVEGGREGDVSTLPGYCLLDRTRLNQGAHPSWMSNDLTGGPVSM